MGIYGLPDVNRHSPAPDDGTRANAPDLGLLPESPKLKLASVSVLIALQDTANADPENPAYVQWRERLLHVCELRVKTLERSLAVPAKHQDWPEIALRLTLLFLDAFFLTSDDRYLNTALKVADHPKVARYSRADASPSDILHALGALSANLCNAALDRVRSSEWHVPVTDPPNTHIHRQPTISEMQPSALTQPNVVVLSPGKYSQYTLAVLELLRHAGVVPKAVIVRKMVSVARLREEVRREGRDLYGKIWRKLILRKQEDSPAAAAPEFPHTTVDAWGKAHDVSVHYCGTLNDDDAAKLLERYAPDAVLYTGGGVIRKHILDLAGRGIVNCHMGMLPPYRGYDVVSWAALNRDFDKIGLTVHFMSEGIDEGDILAMYPAELQPGDTASSIMKRQESRMPEAIIHAFLRYWNGALAPLPQSLENGKQYYGMHQVLRKLADEKLKGGN